MNRTWLYHPAAQRLRGALILPRAQDRYLASFPRSGSTWLRTLVTNVLDPSAQSNPSVFNARIPGVTFRNLRRIHRLPSPRLLKTHSLWLPQMRKAVYLVRHGEDALASYYHYVTSRGGHALTFEEFFESYEAGLFGPPWHRHVESWLGAGRARLGDRLLVVPFEALRADPEATLGRVLAFLGIEASPEAVRAAVAASSTETMRKIERARRGDVTTPDASFYRGGGGSGRSLPPAVQERFRQQSARAMQMAGYPPAPAP